MPDRIAQILSKYDTSLEGTRNTVTELMPALKDLRRKQKKDEAQPWLQGFIDLGLLADIDTANLLWDAGGEDNVLGHISGVLSDTSKMLDPYLVGDGQYDLNALIKAYTEQGSTPDSIKDVLKGYRWGTAEDWYQFDPNKIDEMFNEYVLKDELGITDLTQDDIAGLKKYAEASPEDFLAQIIGAGRSKETTQLLKTIIPDLTEADMGAIFGEQAELPANVYGPAIPEGYGQTWGPNTEAYLDQLIEQGRTTEAAKEIKRMYPSVTQSELDFLLGTTSPARPLADIGQEKIDQWESEWKDLTAGRTMSVLAPDEFQKRYINIKTGEEKIFDHNATYEDMGLSPMEAAAVEQRDYTIAVMEHNERELAKQKSKTKGVLGTLRQFAAAVGVGGYSLIDSIGGALKWLGADGSAADFIGEKLSDVGEYGVKASVRTGGYVPISEYNKGDPQYWAGLVGQMVPSMLTLLIPAYGGYVTATNIASKFALGPVATTLIGGAGGAVASRPIEAMMEAGGSYNETGNSEATWQVFLGNLGLTAADAAQLAAEFAPSTKPIAVALKLAAVASEGGEEWYQEGLQQLARGQGFWEWTPERETSTIGGLIGGGIFAGGGTMLSMMQNATENLPPAVKNEVEDAAKDLLEQGLTGDQALYTALENVAAKSDENKAAIVSAIEEEKQLFTPDTVTPQRTTSETKPAEATSEPASAQTGQTIGEIDTKVPVKMPKLDEETEQVLQKIEGLKATLEEDPVAQFRGSLGKRQNVKLVSILKDGQFPEYLTLNQAKMLYPGHNFQMIAKGPNKGKVWAGDALDDLTKRWGMEWEEITARVEQHGATEQKIAEMQDLVSHDVYIHKLKSKIAELRAKVKETERITASKYRSKLAAEKESQKQVADMRNLLVEYLQSELPLEIRGKFISTVKNVKNTDQLVKAFDRISAEADRYVMRTLADNVNKKLKDISIKGSPEATALLGKVKDAALNGNRADALQKRADNELRLASDDLSPEEIQNIRDENLVLELTGMKEMDAIELQNLLDNVESIRKEGKLLSKARKEKYDAFVQENRDAAIDEMTGGKGLKEGYETVPSEQLEEKPGPVDKLLNTLSYGITELTDKLGSKSKTNYKDNPLRKLFADRVLDADSNEFIGTRGHWQDIRDRIAEVYGYDGLSNRKRNKAIDAKMAELVTMKTRLGEMKNADGSVVNPEFRQSQLVQIYMLAQDPTLDKTFWDSMRWTPGMVDAIADNLSDQDIAMAESLLDFYRTYYDRVNAIYQKIEGVDLPKNEFYSPIKRELIKAGEGQVAQDEADIAEHTLFFRDAWEYASVKNSGLKSRVPNTHKLRFDGAIEVALRHIAQMEHYISHAEVVSDYNRIMKDPGVRAAGRQYGHSDTLRALDRLMDQVTNGSVDKSKTVDFFDQMAKGLRINVTKAMLGGKMRVGLTQSPLVSLPSYLLEVDSKSFFKYGAEFMANPIGNAKMIRGISKHLQKRWEGGLDRDVAQVLQTGKPSPTKSRYQNFIDNMFIFIKANDSATNTIGNYIAYRAELDRMGVKGKPTAEQMEAASLEADRITQRVQESGTLATQSAMQRGGEMYKLMTMFSDSPNKYFRVTARTIANMRSGRISTAEAARRLTVSWVVLPMLFYLATHPKDMWELAQGDIDEVNIKEIGAWIALAPINNLMVVGTIAQAIADKAFDKPWAEVVDLTPVSEVWATGLDVVGDIQKIMGDKSLEEVLPTLMEDIATEIGYIFGAPVPAALKVRDVITSGDVRRIAYSEYALKGEGYREREKLADDQKEIHEMRTYSGIPKPQEEGLKFTSIDDLINAPEEIYTTASEFSAVNKKFGDWTVDEMRQSKGFDARDISAVETKDIKDWLYANSYTQAPISIDYSEIPYTFDRLRMLWNERASITDEDKLKEFDDYYKGVDLRMGNLPAEVYPELEKYFQMTKPEQRAYLSDLKETNRELYRMMTNSPVDIWLMDHPKENAMLSVWGQSKIMNYDDYSEAMKLIGDLKIPRSAVSEYMPNQTVIDQGLFNYYDIAKTSGASSKETKWFLVDLLTNGMSALPEFLDRMDSLDEYVVDGELTQKGKGLQLWNENADKFTQYEGYSDDNSEFYLPSIKDPEDPDYENGREFARAQMLEDDDFRKAQRRYEALNNYEWSDELADKHIEYYEKVRNSLSTKDYTDYRSDRYLQQNDDYVQARIDAKIDKPGDEKILPPEAYDQILSKDNVQRVLTGYEAISDNIELTKAEKEIERDNLLADPENQGVGDDLLRLDAYSKGYPETMIEDYVNAHWTYGATTIKEANGWAFKRYLDGNHELFLEMLDRGGSESDEGDANNQRVVLRADDLTLRDVPHVDGLRMVKEYLSLKDPEERAAYRKENGVDNFLIRAYRFDKVPSPDIEKLYAQYKELPEGSARVTFRYENPALQEWGKRVLGWSDIEERYVKKYPPSTEKWDELNKVREVFGI